MGTIAVHGQRIMAIDYGSMKFFIPDKSPKDAETLYRAFCKSVAGAVSEARIRSITYRIGGETIQGVVGGWDPFEKRTVIAILEAGDRYLIFERGRLSNPISVDKSGVSQVELFDS